MFGSHILKGFIFHLCKCNDIHTSYVFTSVLLGWNGATDHSYSCILPVLIDANLYLIVLNHNFSITEKQNDLGELHGFTTPG